MIADISLIDQRTITYLELISGRKGQAALDAWMGYTGWQEAHIVKRRPDGHKGYITGVQTSIATRLKSACQAADSHYARKNEV